MAKVIDMGYVDTSIAQNPVLVRGKLNYAADWRPVKDDGTETILINFKGPTDRIESQKLVVTKVNNVYDRTGIEERAQGPSKRGINVYLQEKTIVQVTDDTDSMFLEQHPIDVSIVLRTSASQYITAAMVQTVLARAVSGLYDTGSETTARLDAILRGSKKPSGL